MVKGIVTGGGRQYETILLLDSSDRFTVFFVGDTPVLSRTRLYKEANLKSGLLYRICKFSRWSRQMEPDKPFIISIIGTPSPRNEIYIPPERKLHKKNIQIRKIEKLSEVGDTHVLFIAASETYRLDSILAYIADKDILSASSTKDFAKKGVMVNMFMDDETLRFDINREAERKSLVNLHSQLYTIARKVFLPPRNKKKRGEKNGQEK